MKGLAIFYKPKRISSYDLIRKVKKLLNQEKIGHGGSLDPLGQELIKKWPSRNKLNEVLKSFLSDYLQTPPKFSAVKLKGVPAYRLARQGKEVNLGPRKVKIKEIELLSYETDKNKAFLKLRLVVNSGFYVRSFANDLGNKLETGAYLKELCRTRVGQFTINEAITINDLSSNFLELYFKAQGRVQKVFFRDTARRWARKLKLNGEAKNLPNGQEIEIIAQGIITSNQMGQELIKKWPSRNKLNEVLKSFLSDYLQTPPKFSAV
ncbi:hypothetical protein B6D52_03705, partial [Candidatus Parcubacteria bacterium 4484_255]